MWLNMGNNSEQVTRANKKTAKDIFDSNKLGTDTDKLAKFTISKNAANQNIMFKVVPESGRKNETGSQEIKKTSRFKKTAYMFAALTLTTPVAKDLSQAIFDANVKDPTELMAQTKGGNDKTMANPDNLPVIPKSQVMEWVNAAKQHFKNPEVNWAKCTQFSVRSNSDYLMSKGYGNDESISILSLVKNNKGGAYPNIVYNGFSFDITNDCSKIGIKELSSKAHVEYGGYKMRPEDKEMCHFFYIWDVGAKGFIEMSFPGKLTPESKIGKVAVPFSVPIKDDYQFMVVDWLGKNKYGFALYPGTGAKEVGTDFCDGSKSDVSAPPLSNLPSKLGISTSSEKPLLGFFPANANFSDQLILYFPESNKLSAIPFIGNAGGYALVAQR